jgi:hypothetical protein
MIERIPANLRSAEKLYEYFEELFPGEEEAGEGREVEERNICSRVDESMPEGEGLRNRDWRGKIEEEKDRRD